MADDKEKEKSDKTPSDKNSNKTVAELSEEQKLAYKYIAKTETEFFKLALRTFSFWGFVVFVAGCSILGTWYYMKKQYEGDIDEAELNDTLA